MKFTKLVHTEKQCIEYMSKFLGHEASDEPGNTIYEMSNIPPEVKGDNLIVYVDGIRKHQGKDYDVISGRTVKFKEKINKDSSVQLTVIEKI